MSVEFKVADLRRAATTAIEKYESVETQWQADLRELRDGHAEEWRKSHPPDVLAAGAKYLANCARYDRLPTHDGFRKVTGGVDMSSLWYTELGDYAAKRMIKRPESPKAEDVAEYKVLLRLLDGVIGDTVSPNQLRLLGFSPTAFQKLFRDAETTKKGVK